MKLTCSTTLRRTLGVAGLLIGFGLLSAGVASADDGDSSGLLGGVATLVSPLTDAVTPVARQAAPVTSAVAAVADPVLKPVLTAAAPLAEPVLAPLAPTLDSVTQVLSPAIEPLRPVTAPLLTPVVNSVRDVPVVPRIAEPLVAQQSAPADVVPPITVPVVPQAPLTPVSVQAAEVQAVTLSDRVAAVLEVAQWQRISVPAVAPPIEAPSSPSPDLPLTLPGTTGSASSSGSTSPAVADLPAGSGVGPDSEPLAVIADHQVHGSWCYYYGRSHPS
ncbi:hypothetical protein [Nocardia sp. NRRL S-836]|uniref:hypothetical protein n=1 Tax=Nocardia sp. NRRL S-836 TaxID=1519492 RepID=UPI000A8283A4|nr:hypothetical protein [Nocardia sp. NRRL S-836]